jgi:uncharacterized phiE125 gp8 family phage protein
MALPMVDDLRAYLRIENTAEDALLDGLLTQARAAVEAYIGQPITARVVSMTVAPVWGGSRRRRARRLALPFAPIDAGERRRDRRGRGTMSTRGDYHVNAAARGA